jgi:hypothetical protein
VLAHLDRYVVDFLEDFADPSHEWRRLFAELRHGQRNAATPSAGGSLITQRRPTARPNDRWDVSKDRCPDHRQHTDRQCPGRLHRRPVGHSGRRHPQHGDDPGATTLTFESFLVIKRGA